MRSSHQQPGGHGVPPRVLNLLAKQQFELVKNPANGIIFYQNEDGDVLDIQADIIGPVQTAYEGGIFRCKLVIESGFPQNAPKGFFLTKIFHPNVAQNTGEICVNTLKRDWNPAKWSLKHIFEVIKCLLIVPFPESSLNQEAGREFMDDYDSFCEHARVYTQIHAKVSAAQKELIRQHQLEEEKQCAHQSMQSSKQQQSDPGSCTSSSGVSPASIIDLQQLNKFQVQQRNQDNSNAESLGSTVQQRTHVNPTFEESKFGGGFEAHMQTQPSEIQAKLQYAAQNSQYAVLSQVTNNSSRERQSLPGSSQVMMLKPELIMTQTDGLTDHENNSVGSQSQQQQQQLQNIAAYKLLPKQIILNNACNDPQYSGSKLAKQIQLQASGARNQMIGPYRGVAQNPAGQGGSSDLDGLNPNMMSRPAIIRRPSVLYKKKSETAKQRQERYIRRV